jgi:hypothetical protein
MAIGDSTDMQIENEFVHAGWTETVAGTIDGFNAASRNTIRFITKQSLGHYEREDFFGEISGLVEHRVPTSVSAQTPTEFTELRQSKVKVPRRSKLVQNTLDSFQRIGMSENEMYFAIGQQVAKAQMQDMLDTAILALEAALDGQASQEHPDAGAILSVEDLITGLSKMGDAGGQIIQWVQHSKSMYDLMADAVTNAIDSPASMVVIDGNVPSLGRPILVRDAAALVRDMTTDQYITLGLVENAAVVQLDGPPTVLVRLVEGLDNIVVSHQSEWNFVLSLKGMSWDETNGGASPTDTALGVSTNWDQVATDDKNLPGVHIRTL